MNPGHGQLPYVGTQYDGERILFHQHRPKTKVCLEGAWAAREDACRLIVVD